MSRRFWIELATVAFLLLLWSGLTSVTGTPLGLLMGWSRPAEAKRHLFGRVDKIAGLGPPVVAIIGHVVTLRERLRWFDLPAPLARGDAVHQQPEYAQICRPS